MNRTAFFAALAVLLVAALALMALQLARVLLAFAGVLLAVLLRSLAAALCAHLPLPAGAALALVVVGILAGGILLTIGPTREGGADWNLGGALGHGLWR